MTQTFRFSPRPNRAHEIRWRTWGDAVFREAAERDAPILLNLTAVWCHWCHQMDETTYSDPTLIELINSRLIPLRVDADRYPHVQDRYIAGGWPTNAFLTPTGEVLWSGTFIDAAQLGGVAESVLSAWHERRAELELEIARRRRALEAARSHHAAVGLVRRESADDVIAAAHESFDPRNGGFGDAPKFPHPEAIELLYLEARSGDADAVRMADQTLDGMLAGELWDDVDGAFFRYSLEPDWTAPRQEKLLEVNAGLLSAYALGAALRDRPDWAAAAVRTVAWAERTLRRPDGLWGGSQAAEPEYFAADAAGRAARTPPFVDTTIYTTANARWIAALALAGARLDRPEWTARAHGALATLCTCMAAPDGGFHHYREDDGEPRLAFLLTDTVAVARACLVVSQATGDMALWERARELARHAETAYWATEGGFWDRHRDVPDSGMLRYRDRPFELNAEAARLLLDIWSVTGERSRRALAELTLALLSPKAGRYGVAGAVFATAAAEFFQAPLCVFVVGTGEAAAALRRAAFAIPRADLRVWSVAAGHRVGPQLHLPGAAVPVAYVSGVRGGSPAILDAAELAGAVAAVA